LNAVGVILIFSPAFSRETRGFAAVPALIFAWLFLLHRYNIAGFK
jgi:hypothetical protein